MYESEKGYALRSIPAALEHLEIHCQELQINDRRAIFRAVRRLGQDDSSIEDAPDSALTLAAVRAFSTRFMALQTGAGAAIKTIRDEPKGRVRSVGVPF